jgi:phycocyanobilin lyase beta subunit
MSDRISSLIQAVDAADSSQKLLEAVQNLAAANSQAAIPTLIATLSYNNPGAAVAAVDGLIKLGEPTVPALLEQLDNQNYTARSWVIRALAGIGDPRGLVTLLGVATADFAASVRRGATRGLGTMKWHLFPENLIDIAQEEALEALLFVAEFDEEWVVRYAAIGGLQVLAGVVSQIHPEWRSQIDTHFERMTIADNNSAVRARIWMAQQQLQSQCIILQPEELTTSSLSENDWHSILDKLYARKNHERFDQIEGNPFRYKNLVGAISEKSE